MATLWLAVLDPSVKLKGNFYKYSCCPYPIGASATAEGIKPGGSKPGGVQNVVRPKQQLLYLAEVLGFQVQFTDFPKVGRIKKTSHPGRQGAQSLDNIHNPLHL